MHRFRFHVLGVLRGGEGAITLLETDDPDSARAGFNLHARVIREHDALGLSAVATLELHEDIPRDIVYFRPDNPAQS